MTLDDGTRARLVAWFADANADLRRAVGSPDRPVGPCLSPRSASTNPPLEGRELDYIQQAVLGGHTSMNGPFAKRVTALLEDELDAAGVLLTTSCTDALEMAAMLLDAASPATR